MIFGMGRHCIFLLLRCIGFRFTTKICRGLFVKSIMSQKFLLLVQLIGSLAQSIRSYSPLVIGTTPMVAIYRCPAAGTDFFSVMSSVLVAGMYPLNRGGVFQKTRAIQSPVQSAMTTQTLSATSATLISPLSSPWAIMYLSCCCAITYAPITEAVLSWITPSPSAAVLKA